MSLWFSPEWHNNNSHLHENRMLHFADFEKLSDYVNVQKIEDIDIDDYDRAFFSDLQDNHTEGFDEIEAHFAMVDPDSINIDSIYEFLETKNVVTSADDVLYAKFDALYAEPNPNDPTTIETNRLLAEKRLRILISYLKERSRDLHHAREMLEGIRPERSEETFVYTNKALEWTHAKDAFHWYSESWENATGKEKAVMAAGTVAAAYILLKMYSGAPEKIKKYTRIALLAGAVGVTTDAVVSIRERMKNPTEKDWRDANKEEHVNEVVNDLKNTHAIPQEFVTEINEGEKYIYSVLNLSTMTAEQLESLYYSYADIRQVPDDAADYPHAPFSAEDEKRANITPTQRFLILERVAKILFTDEETGEVRVPDEKMDKSVMYLMLDWGADN